MEDTRIPVGEIQRNSSWLVICEYNSNFEAWTTAWIIALDRYPDESESQYWIRQMSHLRQVGIRSSTVIVTRKERR